MRFILTSRDPSSAIALKNLILEISVNGEHQLKLITQSPASEMLDSVLSDHVVLNTDNASHEPKEILINSFRTFMPDVLICGISGPDSGIDEIAIEVAKEVGVPSFAIQSWWGDHNPTCGVLPNTFLVIDQEASKQTRKRFPEAHCIEVGSLAHAHYQDLSVRKLISDGVMTERIKSSRPSLCFYGQPLHFLPGYVETVRYLWSSMESRDIRLLYRPHPKETSETLKVLAETIRTSCQVPFNYDTHKSTLQSLCSHSLILSYYSTVCIDNIYLNRSSPKVFNRAIYLWIEDDLMDWWGRHNSSLTIPLVDAKIIQTIQRKEDLKHQIMDCLSPHHLERLTTQINTVLDPSDSPRKSVEAILAHS
jgi:hypothetical protein